MCGRGRSRDGRSLARLRLDLFSLDFFDLGGCGLVRRRLTSSVCMRRGDDDDFGRICGFHDCMN